MPAGLNVDEVAIESASGAVAMPTVSEDRPAKRVWE